MKSSPDGRLPLRVTEPTSVAPPDQPPRRPSTAGTVLAWLVIFASAAYIITATAVEKRSAPSGKAAVADVGMRVAARYAVGAHHTLGALARATDAGNPNPLLRAVDDAAATRDAKVRAATVAGEIAGAKAALERLDRLARAEGGDDVAALVEVYRSGSADALSSDQRDALVSRHGWFGRLALAHGLSPDHPARRAAIRPAVRTMAVMLSATLLGGAALLAGLALLGIALVRYVDGKLAAAYTPARTPTGPFLEAFAAYIAGMVGVAALARLLLGERVVATWFVVVVLPFVFLWPLLRGVSRPQLRAGLGWHRGRGAWREIGAGVAGYLATLPLLGVGLLVSLLLQRVSGSDTSHPIITQFGGGAWRTARLFLLAAVWAPVVEETMFRGALYHHLRARVRWPAAAALVALLFAAVHPQGWAAIPVLSAIAFSFAALREWRGSIIAPVVAHAINNGSVTLLLVMMLG